MWGNDAPNNANRVQFFTFAVFSQNNFGYFLNNGYLTNTTALNTPNRQLYEFFAQTGVTNGTSVWFNGTIGSAGTGTELVNTPQAGNATLYFGGGETNSIYPSHIEFNEIIGFDAALTTQQRQQMEGYLAAKWGLQTNLPASHPYKTLPVLTRPFLPLDISGCEAWFDGADRTAMTLSGNTVMQWLDKSGNGRHASTSGTQAPVVGQTTTGRTTLSFNGSSYLSMSGASTLAAASATYFLQASASSPNNRTLLAMWQNARVMGPTYYWNTGGNVSLSPSTWLDTNAVLTVTENSASNCTVHFNGTLRGTMAYRAKSFTESYASAAANDVFIGAHWSRDNLWVGTIQEIIMYNGALTTIQRQQVEAYLVNKWGTRGSTPAGHYSKLAVPLMPVFLPTAIATCGLWLDAADTGTITRSGNTVTQWNDMSGNNRHATSDGGSGATYVANGLNRNGLVSFDGSTSMLGSFPVNGLTTMTIAVVANNKTGQADGFNDTMSLIAWFENDSWGQVFLDLWQTQIGWRFGTGQDQNDNGYGFPSSQGEEYSLVLLSKESTVERLFHNGMNVATNGGKSTTINGTEATYRLSAGNFGPPSTNNVCEILVFTSPLSSLQRQQLEGYFAAKWGLQGKLPATHPYKKFTP